MPTNIYCTYLTVYTGNTLPPFYLGSTSIDKINKGYRGSVSSEKYKSIWKQEIASHPDLFKTIILTRHETRQEAMEREVVFQEAFSVARNPLYINMAHANGKFFVSGPRSAETKAKIGVANTGKKRSPEAIAKTAAAHTGQKHTPESKAKMSDAQTGKKRSPEAIAKTAAANTGKKLGPQSPEHKAKRVAAQTGKKRTSETKAKMSAAQTGKKLGPQSPEHKAKRLSARLVTLSKKNLLI
jgi:hypothetical protein